jgi:hypothetical protein
MLSPPPEQFYTAEQMRALVVEQLLIDAGQDPTGEGHFRQHHDGLSVDEYARRMSRDGEYGGMAEIQAFANRFQVNVQVWFGNQPRTFLVRNAPCQHVPVEAMPLINLGLVNHNDEYSAAGGGLNHYVSVEPPPRR